MAMASFTYSKLPPESDTTRMLRLLPHKESNAQIRGELIDYDLSDTDGRRHLYEALSYVWYDGEESRDTKPESIILNNCIFFVTRNLYAALLHLRNHQFERTLDDDEKQKQIPLMRTIYAQASCVIVWLGEARNNSDEAFEIIRRLAGDSVDYGSSNDESPTAPNMMIDRDACEMLLQRNWFRRIWVLQEVGVARCISIMCGHVEMNGYMFCKGFSRLKALSPRSLSHIHPYRPDSRGTLSIGELIDMYQHHNATLQHDKVYALLGLSADDPQIPALKPNYALPWNDVHKQVTTYLFGGKSVIKGKGWILGYIKSVEARASGCYQGYVNIVLNHTADWVGDELNWIDQWIPRAPEGLVQKADIICLLEGSSRPSIIRLCKDHFETVVAAITPPHDRTIFDFKPQEWHSISGFVYDIILTWRIPRAGAESNIALQGTVELTNIAPELFNMSLTQSKGTVENSALERMVVQWTENFQFSEDVAKAAAANYHENGHNIITLLIKYQPSLPITEDVVKAAAANPGEAGYLSLPITEDVVKTAAANGALAGIMVIRLLIRHQGKSAANRTYGHILPITEDVVKAAASACNKGKTLKLLIRHYRESLPITKDVIKEAAKNDEPENLQLLVDYLGYNLPISIDVINAVATDCTVENLSLLFQY
ncbi:heterokaryon incompatibility protein-domain-containing protein [Aspergillus caelatus]|uniref:Heterokaryon incompatibility protein-domain-containing protein n=1 Tax=Aspergillus caelatus TaxID=61420 RepID=A0A5N6ZYB2_9EURO|nr:heterokaryon incompatibility protein-domain-containing protein [Aspergillus caelatus]KAE8361280.1 heterokaryon incompatibility protein-domain-containing protein [Aspergillus caelatus]